MNGTRTPPTAEPECPFSLDDNDDQAIQGAVATLQTLAVSFVLMFSFVSTAGQKIGEVSYGQ